MKKYLAVFFAVLPVLICAQGSQIVARAADASTAQAPKPKQAGYVGSKSTKQYHLASCQLAQGIKPEDAMKFSSKSAAKKAGYSPCAVCLK